MNSSNSSFKRGNALNLAIAVVVGTQFQQVVNALTEDLLMPLLNPLIRNGGWEEWVIPYAGGELLLGQAMNVMLNSLIVGGCCSCLLKRLIDLSGLLRAVSTVCVA